MGMVGSVLRVCFALTLAIFMLAEWLVCRLLTLCPCISERTRQGCALVSCRVCWSGALLLAPWIWITGEPGEDEVWAEILKQLESDDPRPVFLLGNHTSFMDTFVSVAKMPTRVVYRSRTYAADYLLNMPILGTIIRSMGHFPVAFKGKADGDFSVDREKMAQIQTRVDNHIQSGGVLSFFPEGQLNNNPAEIMPFRYGGIKVALQNDALLYQFTTTGCPESWPKRAQVGGFPGRIRYGIRPMAPEGTKKLLEKLRTDCSAEDSEKADAALLSEHLRNEMQKFYNELAAKNGTGKKEN